MRLVSYNQLFDLLGGPKGFDSTIKRHFDDYPRMGSAFPVRMDLIKDESGFKILAELPGMEKDKIKIMVENGILTISGERTRKDDNGDEFIRAERYYGNFTRSFTLPETIEKSGISADYKNGLLEVTLPVKPEEKPKQVEVKVS